MQRAIREKRTAAGFRFGIIIGLFASVIFIADLLIKQFLRENYAYTSTPVIPNIFNLNVVFNTGAAFSILRQHTDWLIYVGLIFLLVFLVFAVKEPAKDLIHGIGYGLIFGGALNNLYDRIFLGFVVDYLDFIVWPVFNLSDTAICVGVSLLFIASFNHKKAN